MGHAVSEQGIHTDPSKIETVRNWPVPRNVKEIRTLFRIQWLLLKICESICLYSTPIK